MKKILQAAILIFIATVIVYAAVVSSHKDIHDCNSEWEPSYKETLSVKHVNESNHKSFEINK